MTRSLDPFADLSTFETCKNVRMWKRTAREKRSLIFEGEISPILVFFFFPRPVKTENDGGGGVWKSAAAASPAFGFSHRDERGDGAKRARGFPPSPGNNVHNERVCGRLESRFGSRSRCWTIFHRERWTRSI